MNEHKKITISLPLWLWGQIAGYSGQRCKACGCARLSDRLTLKEIIYYEGYLHDAELTEEWITYFSASPPAKYRHRQQVYYDRYIEALFTRVRARARALRRMKLLTERSKNL